jgi:hypothetical protein
METNNSSKRPPTDTSLQGREKAKQKNDVSGGTGNAGESHGAAATGAAAEARPAAADADTTASYGDASVDSEDSDGKKVTAAPTSRGVQRAISLGTDVVVEEENNATTTTTNMYCFVDLASGGRWFVLPSDIEPTSRRVLRPMYLPYGPFYERRPVTDLWQKMSDVTNMQWQWRALDKIDISNTEWWNTRRRLLVVFGPPGSGKSTAAYAWMWYTCLKAKCNALWMECADTVVGIATGWCLTTVNGKVNVTAYQWEEKPTLQDLKALAADIVIFDGLRQGTHEGWMHTVKTLCDEGVAVVLVSSEGLRIHQGSLGPVAEILYRVPSWTLEEYNAACMYNAFWESVSYCVETPGTVSDEVRNMAIEKKYRVAGHSARFMFGYMSDEVESKLFKAAAMLENIAALRHALRNWANSQSVNQLMAWLWENGATPRTKASFLTNDDLTIATSDLSLLAITNKEFWSAKSRSQRNVFVSRYALEQVQDGIQMKVDQMREIARTLNQPAVMGYAFELRFLDLLRNHANGTDDGIVVRRSADTQARGETWSVGHVVTSEDIVTTIAGMSIQDRQNSWIWVGGNVTAFDAVHILPPRNGQHWIRFVQVTSAESHDLMLFAVELALKQLAGENIFYSHVDFVFVRPNDDMRSFSWKKCVGGLKSGVWKTFGGDMWRDSNKPTDLVPFYTVAWG